MNPFTRALSRMDAPKPRGRSAYQGAWASRLTSADWIFAASRSADQESRYDLRTLRNRGRELVRNSPYGKKYSGLLAEKLVGKGFHLTPKNLLPDGTHNTKANAAIAAAFKEWSWPENADLAGKLGFTEMLALESSSWGSDGEILIRMYLGDGYGPFGFQIQPLDPDLLDENFNQPATGTTNLISQGVEFDARGRPVFYHLWDRHPSETGYTGTRTAIPAEQIIHAFLPLRAGQSRGVPHAAAILFTLKMLDGYFEAELVASRAASSTMGALEDIPNDPDAAPRNTNSGAQDVTMEVNPGELMDLRGTGSKLSLWDPQHPTNAFPDFTRMMSRLIATGFEVSYGTLTGDLSQANYGSLRVGSLDERDHWRRLQQFLIVHVIRPIYRQWLKMALASGAIPGVLGYDPVKWGVAEWRPRGFPWIDPLKDAQGKLIEVAAGTSSLTRMAAENGDDLEDVVRERAEENALFKKYGVSSVLATQITDRPTDSTDDGAPPPADPDAAKPSGKGWLVLAGGSPMASR